MTAGAWAVVSSAGGWASVAIDVWALAVVFSVVSGVSPVYPATK